MMEGDGRGGSGVGGGGGKSFAWSERLALQVSWGALGRRIMPAETTGRASKRASKQASGQAVLERPFNCSPHDPISTRVAGL